jgi:hypothetical protein
MDMGLFPSLEPREVCLMEQWAPGKERYEVISEDLR